jgi:hypothetical protein
MLLLKLNKKIGDSRWAIPYFYLCELDPLCMFAFWVAFQGVRLGQLQWGKIQ